MQLYRVDIRISLPNKCIDPPAVFGILLQYNYYAIGILCDKHKKGIAESLLMLLIEMSINLRLKISSSAQSFATFNWFSSIRTLYWALSFFPSTLTHLSIPAEKNSYMMLPSLRLVVGVLCSLCMMSVHEWRTKQCPVRFTKHVVLFYTKTLVEPIYWCS